MANYLHSKLLNKCFQTNKSLRTTVSHLNLTANFAVLPREPGGVIIKVWVVSGVSQCETKHFLNVFSGDAKAHPPFPVFWKTSYDRKVPEQDGKPLGCLYYYVGHFRGASFTPLESCSNRYKGKPCLAMLELEFVEFDNFMANKMRETASGEALIYIQKQKQRTVYRPR